MTARIKVKFCGLTSPEDALAAIQAGADLLGFNFYARSPRSVSLPACRYILNAIRPAMLAQGVQSVGVFVNHSLAQVIEIMNTLRLDLAQLHGDEPPEQVRALHGRGYKVLRVKEAENVFDPHLLNPFNNPLTAPALLLDAAVPGQYGGTGQVADWGLAQQLAQRYPLLLAGGLRPDNVAAAVAAVHPWGVDAASGVESSPGKKDIARMNAFVQAVRESICYANTAL